MKPGLSVEDRPVDVDPELAKDGKVPLVAGAECGISVSK
jgi:hypothetical protein